VEELTYVVRWAADFIIIKKVPLNDVMSSINPKRGKTTKRNLTAEGMNLKTDSPKNIIHMMKKSGKKILRVT
jgi:hypothetical protein